jgi:two-component system chemotaxis response regulator CheB
MRRQAQVREQLDRSRARLDGLGRAYARFQAPLEEPVQWTLTAGFPIVAIAASAGGVAALLELVRRLPDDLPAAIVVALHRGSHGPSLLIDLLRRASRLPVEEAENGMRLRAGTITLPPVGSHITIESGARVVLEPRRAGDLVCPSADRLFMSIAASGSDRHIAVVLTGYGTDGSFGTRAIGATGGTVIIEDEATAAFPDMPATARQLGHVDFMLPLEHIPFAISQLSRAPVDLGGGESDRGPTKG